MALSVYLNKLAINLAHPNIKAISIIGPAKASPLIYIICNTLNKLNWTINYTHIHAQTCMRNIQYTLFTNGITHQAVINYAHVHNPPIPLSRYCFKDKRYSIFYYWALPTRASPFPSPRIKSPRPYLILCFHLMLVVAKLQNIRPIEDFITKSASTIIHPRGLKSSFEFNSTY